MKRNQTLILILLIAAVLVTMCGAPALAQRVKPEKAYITSAKIAILGHRPTEGIIMLDSLLANYGPHAAAYYWMALIEIDLMNGSADLDAKRIHVDKLMAYSDSLNWTCDKDNKDVKKKYKKDCDKFTSEIDSLDSYYWKTYYNAGVRQIDEVERITGQLANATDTTEIAYFSNRLDAQIDSCIANMQLAIAIDKADSRTYIGIASAYEKMGKYSTANEWLEKALTYAADSSKLLIKIAYNYINQDDYCAAVPYLNTYVNQMLPNQQVMSDSANKQAVVNNMFNLTICLNNCKMFDSSYAVSTKILEIDPNNANVLTNAGRYHKQRALAANDSATYYSKQGDTAAAKMWRQKKDEEFVKAVDYLQKSFKLQPESVPAAEELGIIAFLLEKYDLATTAFTQATKLDSTNYEDWTSLGDCYLRLQDWQKSADAYEKSLALKPNNKTVMEQLVLLYQELGKKKLADEMQAKIKNL